MKMRFFNLWTSYILLLISQKIHGEVYSSASEMIEVFKLERELINIMDGFALKLQSKLDKINAYLEEFDEVVQERRNVQSDDALMEKIISNPIHAYKMMKRFAVDWQLIEKDLQTDEWSEVEFMLKKKRLGNVIPREEDLHGAAQALIRLQDVYELDIRDISKGDLGSGRQRMLTKAQLSAQDCLFMGKHCFNSGSLARSLEWFEEAWIMAGMEGNRTLKQEQVQSFLDHAGKVHDTKVLKGERTEVGQLFPKPVYEEPPTEQRMKMINSQKQIIKKNLTSLVKYDEAIDIPRFNALCRGEELRPLNYVAKLKCYLKHNNDPFYRLNPFKEEVVHLEPGIWVYHDVASALDTDAIRSTAAPFMARSQVQGQTKQSQSQVSMTRTSKTGWVQDSFHPAIGKMSERIKKITGLLTNTYYDEAELLQVANYINGGHYAPHHDYVMKEKDPGHMITRRDGLFIGDRIATWMFYLNEVKAGGRTVFPRVGAGVKPVEGSAVFWYNLHESGDPDKLTLHGACPVLYGTKWVSNKWIREGAQVFTKPCGLKHKTKYDFE